MVVLLGRSKSQRFKNNRKDQSADSGVAASRPIIERDGRSLQRGRDARAALSPPAVVVTNFSTENIARPKTAGDVDPSIGIKAHISITSEEETYQFPTPVFRSFAFNKSPATSSPALRSDTPDTIGLAIGSPSQAPSTFTNFPSPANAPLLAPPSNDTRTPSPKPFSNTTINSPLPRANETRDTKSEREKEKEKERAKMNQVEKPKISRWKSIFGGGKKATAAGEQTSKYLPVNQQLSPEKYSNWSGSTYTQVIATGSPPRSAWKQRDKPKVKRSATLPVDGTWTRPDGSPIPPPKDEPYLNVDIPDVQMERYSVMFKGLLPGQRLTRQPSNLLARRQANNEKSNTLKPLDITHPARYDSHQPRRRATSPQPAASPSMRLVLFPPESSTGQRLERADSLINRPRPLRRTRTAPGALSPTPSMDGRDGTEPSPMYEENEELLSANLQALTPTPSTPSQPSTPKDEVRPRTGGPPGAKNKASEWKYTLIEEEPAWEMLTVHRERSDSKDSDAVRITTNQPEHLPLSIPESVEEDWHHTAEVSIARSLSVTRPRMQLLRPVKVDSERFVEKKVLTPTLTQVNVRSRKSVRVMIEDA